jgi:hypothetical protein
VRNSNSNSNSHTHVRRDIDLILSHVQQHKQKFRYLHHGGAQ